MKNKAWINFILFSGAMLLSGCMPYVKYSAEPIEAWLVDAKTKQPIEGAVVVAHWELYGASIVDIGVTHAGNLQFMETMTDKNGRFYFPAWGPLRAWGSRLTFDDPEMFVFKSGYDTRLLKNEMTTEAIGGQYYPLRTSQWNKKTIELESMDAQSDKYVEGFVWINHSVEFQIDWYHKECNWRKLPNTLRAFYQERLRLKAAGIDLRNQNPHKFNFRTIDAGLIDDEKRNVERGCGSAKDFFKEVLQ